MLVEKDFQNFFESRIFLPTLVKYLKLDIVLSIRVKSYLNLLT